MRGGNELAPLSTTISDMVCAVVSCQRIIVANRVTGQQNRYPQLQGQAMRRVQCKTRRRTNDEERLMQFYICTRLLPHIFLSEIPWLAELIARRYLRDLRRSAFVDLRG